MWRLELLLFTSFILAVNKTSAMADSSKPQDDQPPSSHNPEVLKPQMSNFSSPSSCAYSCWPACYWHRGCRKAYAGQEVSPHHMKRSQVVSHQALTVNSHSTAKALLRRKDGALISLDLLWDPWVGLILKVTCGLRSTMPNLLWIPLHIASGMLHGKLKTWIDLTED